MRIQPAGISYKRQVAFNGKMSPFASITKDKYIQEKIAQLSSNKETGDIFKGLSVIAGSLLAEFALFTEQNADAKSFVNNLLKEFGPENSDDINNGIKQLFQVQNEQTKTEEVQEESKEAEADTQNEKTDFSNLIDEKPERKLYLKITSYFPNLDAQYKQALKTAEKEPQNEDNNFTLNIIESIFNFMSEDSKRLISMRSYMHALDKHSDYINGIAENITSTIKGGKTPMQYLVLLNNGKLTDNDIQNWAKCKNLTIDEFMLCKNFDNKIQSRIDKVKEKYNSRFNIADITAGSDDEQPDITKYKYRLKFDTDLGIHERMTIVKDMHEALYGVPVCFPNSKDYTSQHLEHDIQTEMLDNIIKDRRMDATYTFVKFVQPHLFKDINLTAQDVKFLEKDSEEYKKIKDICTKALMNLNFNNHNLKELCKVIEDENIFKDYFTTRHAKMRFITRIVLKDNPNPQNFVKKCQDKMEKFNKEMLDNSDKCYYYCYKHPKGLAPQFYLSKSRLGNYLKVTLNSEGYIHTIYEDFNKELKAKGGNE